MKARVITNVDALHLTAFVSDTVRHGVTVYTDVNTSIAGRHFHETVNHSSKEYVKNTVYTDVNTSIAGRHFHETVNHSSKEYVKNMAHVNGVESFWVTLKRSVNDVYHHLSKKDLQQYIDHSAANTMCATWIRSRRCNTWRPVSWETASCTRGSLLESTKKINKLLSC